MDAEYIPQKTNATHIQGGLMDELTGCRLYSAAKVHKKSKPQTFPRLQFILL
jgi:hypothetical protein